jgi:hypothetical protein
LNETLIVGPTRWRLDFPCQDEFPEGVPAPCLGFLLLLFADDWLEDVCLELVPVGGAVLDVVELPAF